MNVATRAALFGIEPYVVSRLNSLRAAAVVDRLWNLDYRLWPGEQASVLARLGWLQVASRMLDEAASLRTFARSVQREGFDTAVLLGMGGSALAAEAIARTLGSDDGMTLEILDTTDPAAIRSVSDSLDYKRTLFIVSSKSGTTIETMCLFDYFWHAVADGSRFVAITDQGTPLHRLGIDRQFRSVFLNPADIGGRYSGLSFFGLVPAALIGVDIDRILLDAQEMAQACKEQDVAENPGAWLGTVIAEAAAAGREKLTLSLEAQSSALGPWIEQLVAESTGKNGKGILPVVGEALGPPSAYGPDRIFVHCGPPESALHDLEAQGQPVAELDTSAEIKIGSEFFRWEFATAVAGHVLGINPFDEPQVAEVKELTQMFLAQGATAADSPNLDDIRGALAPGKYLAIQAFIPANEQNSSRLERVRLGLRNKYGLATTVGFGPRYLHSTGQFHKAGPNSGVFVQLLGEDAKDLAIPGRTYSFGQLKRAQAMADIESLRRRNRPVARVNWDQLAEL